LGSNTPQETFQWAPKHWETLRNDVWMMHHDKCPWFPINGRTLLDPWPISLSQVKILKTWAIGLIFTLQIATINLSMNTLFLGVFGLLKKMLWGGLFLFIANQIRCGEVMVGVIMPVITTVPILYHIHCGSWLVCVVGKMWIKWVYNKILFWFKAPEKTWKNLKFILQFV